MREQIEFIIHVLGKCAEDSDAIEERMRWVGATSPSPYDKGRAAAYRHAIELLKKELKESDSCV